MSGLLSSRFGRFLLHGGWFRSGASTRARAFLSTGCNAVSPRRYVHRTDHIGVLLITTVHALVNYPPKVSASRLVNSLKGVSSRMIRLEKYPSIRRQLWGDALWSPSYFAGSCAGAPIAVIRRYIEQQKTPD